MKKQYYIILGSLAGLIIILLAINSIFFSSELESGEKGPNLDCIKNTTMTKIIGTSLLGIYNNGESIEVLYGFYDCNEVKRGDLVVFSYAGSQIPLVKIAKGLPFDSFNLTPSGSNWNLIINGEIVKNSNNNSYLFNEARYKMLNLYVKDYKHIIPADSYLLLGNVIRGSTDSSAFGLVSKNNILGKVKPK